MENVFSKCVGTLNLQNLSSYVHSDQNYSST